MIASEENDEGLLENDNFLDAEDLFDDDGVEDQENDTNNKGDNEDEKGTSDSKPAQKKRVVRNPRVLLNFERLKSANGIDALTEIFEKFKFRGKHFEKEDLAAVMRSLQHWMCHFLYPGYDIETCMKGLERLGRKRVVQTHIKRLRGEARTKAFQPNESSYDNVDDLFLNSTEFNDAFQDEIMEV